MPNSYNLTVKDLIAHSRLNDWGRVSVTLTDGTFIVSIVGGRGLYGDFKETFEVAILTSPTLGETKFVTTLFYPDEIDDVLPYRTIEEINDIILLVFKGGDYEFK